MELFCVSDKTAPTIVKGKEIYIMATKKSKTAEPDIIEKKRKQAPSGKTSERDSDRDARKPRIESDTDRRDPAPPNPDSIGNQAMIFIMAILAIFFAFCLILTDLDKGVNGISGPIGYYTCRAIYGTFGYAAWVIPLVFVMYAAFWKRSVVKNIVMPKLVIGILLVATLSALIQTVGLTAGAFDTTVKFWDLDTFWDAFPSRQSGGGGIVGGFLGGMLYAGFKAVSLVVMAAIVLTAIMFMFEITPSKLWRVIVRFFSWMGRKISESRERAKERRAMAREAAEIEAKKKAEARAEAEKEEEIRRAKEKAERERLEREKAEKEEKERLERERLEREEKEKQDQDKDTDTDSDKKTGIGMTIFNDKNNRRQVIKSAVFLFGEGV